MLAIRSEGSCQDGRGGFPNGKAAGPVEDDLWLCPIWKNACPFSLFPFFRGLETDCHGKTNTHKRVVPCLVPDEFSSPEQTIISSPVEMLLAYCWQQLREWVFGEARREMELPLEEGTRG